MSHIVLFDPALQDNNGVLSSNLGDCIISESTNLYLREIFGTDIEIYRYSTHTPLSLKLLKNLKHSDYCFVGGSNLLSSKISNYNQWKLFSNPSFFNYFYPNLSKLILFGVGWWQYQENPNFLTSRFYGKIFNGDFVHSVRDNYTLNKLKKIGISNIINTSCPTTWNLNGRSADRLDTKPKNVILTLTDYSQNVELDNKLINILLKYYNNLFFFPQGKSDLLYLNSLDIYKKNKNKFTILNENVLSLDIFTSDSDVDFIGTRLHGGIKCLQKNIQTLIIGIDNRANEIHKDINLPVVNRNDLMKIEQWINGNSSNGKISINQEAINIWKNQFQ